MFNLWAEKDSNLRTLTRTDLQSVAFNHSAIYPRHFQTNNLKIFLHKDSLILLILVTSWLSRWRDSNPRPADYKSAALANWATSAQNSFIYKNLHQKT